MSAVEKNYPTGRTKSAWVSTLDEFKGTDSDCPELIDDLSNLIDRSRFEHRKKNSDPSDEDLGEEYDRLSEINRQAEFLLQVFACEELADKNIPLMTENDWSEAYLNSHLFKNTFEETVAILKGKQSDRNGLVGRVFEDLAYGLLPRADDGSEVIVSPVRTVQFMQVLYPNAMMTERNYGHHNYFSRGKGIYVPDGLVLKKEEDGNFRINEVLEYTSMANWKSKLELQYQSFLILKRKFPKIFDDAVKFKVVIPSDGNINEDSLRQIGEKDDLVIYSLPEIYRRNVANFADKIYTGALPESLGSSAKPSLS